MTGRSRQEHGFSLIEVLAGLALSGVMLVGLVGLFQGAVVKTRLSDETTRSTVLAGERLERLITLPNASVELNPGATTEYLSGGFVRRTFIKDDAPSPGTKTIKVTVTRRASTRNVTVVALRPRA